MGTCRWLSSALKALSVFIPYYSLLAMTYDACRRKVKCKNHSQLKKTEKETSIRFQWFINNCIIPVGYLKGHFGHLTNPHGRVLFNLFLRDVQSHCLLKEFVLQKWWHLIQTYCDRKQTYRHEMIKHGTAAIVWMWDTMGRAPGTIHLLLWRHR